MNQLFSKQIDKMGLKVHWVNYNGEPMYYITTLSEATFKRLLDDWTNLEDGEQDFLRYVRLKGIWIDAISWDYCHDYV